MPDYRQVELQSDMPDAAWYESEAFSANGFRPMLQNPAFQRMSVRDGYWAAKILSAFTDEHLRTAVAQGQYRDEKTAAYMTRTLAERRDKICRYWFDRVAPLDFFIQRGHEIVWQDLGASRGIYESTPVYRAKIRSVDADRDGADDVAWIEIASTSISLEQESVTAKSVSTHPFVELEVEVDRGQGFGPGVYCYLSRVSGRVVEVHRDRH